ncbi:sensor histidine kinase [Methylobacterium gnaphalii]|uniref:histidine kinase n=1 Tax=Methylobacterium gnaphalii TaxID=1010610 RepID=A0A512JQB5_9HYPH|nr:HAMP domain-containing sensor histidine kinase [Methylobacterium gnaphalii]GEP12155.1 hypothetical protein MGN01_40000 [Methylobacterium gnaphalii]GJD70020.1 Adaptive-response sensory-kinase SasA [Methylobacterium gnaphalii]GLS48914.1 hypothetical protein GCM10007885_17610 [Methylobacterium gnaphalii]
MRVGPKIALVGGIPFLIAAAIATAAWTLLSQEEKARGGAIMASEVYHDLDLIGRVRDQYIAAPAGERGTFADEFSNLTRRAEAGLERLRQYTRTTEQTARIGTAREALARYGEQMDVFVKITRATDARTTDMGRRAGTLIDLVNRARLRQQGSNADLVHSLTEKIESLRRSRDIVSGIQAVRSSAIEVALERARGGDRAQAQTLQLGQFREASRGLAEVLRTEGRGGDADELEVLSKEMETGREATGSNYGERLADWTERLLKVDASNQQTIHDEMAQLLTYSVQANEAEQATQNVAVSTLKLGQRTTGALQHRNPDLANGMLGEGDRLAMEARALPISPLIQSEMVQAIVGWRERLSTTILGLRRQNTMIEAMDRLAGEMRDSARSLNDAFIGDAERLGVFLQRLLLAGAAIGLTVGVLLAALVARSILVPLRALQDDMMTLAADPAGAPVAGTRRRDELGDIARATAHFVSEIARREAALRRAKDRADSALDDLRRTQDDLVRAEKLASLGQLVAGVAHEINTPLGIALTTATSVRDDTRSFRSQLLGGTLSKARLTGFLGRVEEGVGLLCANLARAADLVHGFKQVAVDRVSDERRSVNLSTWLDDLLASLQPLLRRGGHRIERICPLDLSVETNPGALAQVVTNLINNAVVHAFAVGRPGLIRVVVARTDDSILLDVEDNGRGIVAADLGRIFDPFYTTARGGGSTGLGMHIVHNLVTATLKGRIGVESEPDRGTKIRIEFPAGVVGEPPHQTRLRADSA